jgi:3-(3-hydroxy-phenyl)propionate hydroxylase
MPDLELATTDGALRVYQLLHDARPPLLNLGAPGSVDIAGWADRVRLTDESHQGEWELLVIGVVSAPTAILVRPEGYVGWWDAARSRGFRRR